jgi:hypothetical protein
MEELQATVKQLLDQVILETMQRVYYNWIGNIMGWITR